MIKVTELTKSYGNLLALNRVSFTAENGNITGLLGPNGAGKTTTMRILYTILRSDSGNATIADYDVNHDPLEVRKRIGALPDHYGLYDRLTARENIRYYGRLHGMAGGILEERICELIGIMDIENIADRKAGGFSKGEYLKVAISRAMVHDPRYLILDEPTSGLDVMSTRNVRTMLRRLRDNGVCVLFSSHIMQEVSALCDSIVIYRDGEIASIGTPEAIREISGEPNLEDAFIKIIGTDRGLQ